MEKPTRKELSNALTETLLTKMYGEEYTNPQNWDDDDFSYFNAAWDDLNERFYDMLKIFYGDKETINW